MPHIKHYQTCPRQTTWFYTPHSVETLQNMCTRTHTQTHQTNTVVSSYLHAFCQNIMKRCEVNALTKMLVETKGQPSSLHSPLVNAFLSNQSILFLIDENILVYISFFFVNQCHLYFSITFDIILTDKHAFSASILNYNFTRLLYVANIQKLKVMS